MGATSTVKERVEIELLELNEKLDKLNKFIFSDACAKLVPAQRELLLKQSLAMKEYADILSARLQLM